MPDSTSFSRSALSLRWLKPASLIVMGGILAFVLWTLPHWGMFWSHVWQFPRLWQLPANRPIILALTVKIFSPLLLMGIGGIIAWLTFLLRTSHQEEDTDPARVDRRQQIGQTEQRSVPHTSSHQVHPPPTREMPLTMLSPPPAPQTTSASRSADPETPLPPLPPTLSLAQSPDTAPEASDHPDHPSSVNTPLLIVPARQTNEPIPTSTSALPSSPLISLHLLKEVSIVINVPGGRQVVVPLTPNAKRVQLLAYIAWRRGEMIDRDKILEHIFGWGLSDEEATEDKLSERFESHKKLLRKKIREVVGEQINRPAGRQILDPELLDPFVSDSGFWGLSAICRVEDLEAIEASHKVITLARREGQLVDGVPDEVRHACKQIISWYAGDFLEALLKKYPGEFRPWQGRSSWVRKPYTLYRDYYLDALWYAAEAEWRAGQRSGERGAAMGEAEQRKQQEAFGRAAQTFESYAMYACNSRFDAKATFGAHGQMGERIGMSERALRRCVVLFGAIGRTDLVNQVWSAYWTQMKHLSDQRWQPSKETLDDVQAAGAQTSAYRFAAQIAQRSSAFAEGSDRVS